MSRKIIDCLTSLDESVRHLTEINKFSRVNHDLEVRMLAQSSAPYPEEEEHGRIPPICVPFARNDLFYGRSAEMKKINDYLDWRGPGILRTYTIYDRRGVGKTALRLNTHTEMR